MRVIKLSGDLKNSVKDLNGDAIPSMMRKKIFVAASLIFIGVAARLWLYNFLPSTPHIYITLAGIKQPLFMMDIFFVVAAISLIAGRYLGSLFAFLIPLSIMAITDILIGNTIIFLFTWSGFALLGSIGYLSRKKGVLHFFGYSVAGIIAYDLWTNFGCWMGWYSHDISGLLLCYALAIPFMLWHLLATMTVLPLFTIPFEKSMVQREIVSKEAKIATLPTALLMALSIFTLL
ncbi:MAG TPA: hypothetical protein ENL42_03220 [Thermoplasmatales archaeon]|nr:hypothetical protein [Thermoplasmatales archaeon]